MRQADTVTTAEKATEKRGFIMAVSLLKPRFSVAFSAVLTVSACPIRPPFGLPIQEPIAIAFCKSSNIDDFLQSIHFC